MKKNLTTTFSKRQYMLSKDFEIYYYNDSRFSGVRMHSHDYYEFYFYLEGDVGMQFEDTLFPMKPGDMLLIPPGISHQAIHLGKEKAYRRFVFWLEVDYVKQLESISPSFVYIMQQAVNRHYYHYHYDLIEFNTIQAMIFRLIEETRADRYGQEAMIPLMLNELILHLNRSAYLQDHPNTPHQEQNLYDNLIQYIEAHLEEDLSLEQLASIFYVSKFHISHIFKENLGLSIHQYITKKRLALCRDAILSSIDIGKAYLMYGFKDYSSFFRAFRKEYGISPKEYRELHSVVQADVLE